MNTIIQISDCHIDDSPQTMGTDTHNNLSKTINEIVNHIPDALIITGDLAHNGSLKSYKIIKTYLSKLNIDTIILPGNHDNIDNILKEFPNNLLREHCLGSWGIVSAYSKQENKVSGYLSAEELSKLNEALNLSTAKYNIVIIHHPPVPMCSSWDDSLSLQNMDDFFAIINKYSKVRAILWGHAHQSAEFNYNDITLVSCPSTAIQFDQESRVGFNRYLLHNDGKFEYETKWI